MRLDAARRMDGGTRQASGGDQDLEDLQRVPLEGPHHREGHS